MGFTIMETFMDQIEVSSEVGRGTQVRLVKRLNSQQIGMH
jgi:stage II sporulation protein AB (anti-sigma F factor)